MGAAIRLPMPPEPPRHATLVARLDEMIDHAEDHVVLVDVDVADGIDPRVVSLGKKFRAVRREPVVV